MRKVCSIAITFILIASLFPFQAFAATGNSPFKSGTYTHSSVFDGMNIYNGIDVSEHQKTINYVSATREISQPEKTRIRVMTSFISTLPSELRSP